MNTGQVRYIFRNFPLSSIHPHAQKAAEAAECAGEQGKYWEMHDLLFAGQEQWSGSADAVATFKGMAGDLSTGRSLIVRELGDHHRRIGLPHAAIAISFHLQLDRLSPCQEIVDLLLESLEGLGAGKLHAIDQKAGC